MVGDLIRRTRESRGLSQRALAAAVGVGFPHISKIETGHEAPSDALLVRLAWTLGLDADELVVAAGRVPEKYVRALVVDPARAVTYLRAYESSAGGASAREGEGQAGPTEHRSPPAEVATPPADLQRVLVRVFTALYPPTSEGPGGVIDYTDLPEHVRAVVRERDQLQAEVSKWALRAHKAGVPVALDHETGQWSIHDKSPAGGNIEPMPDPYEFFSAGASSTAPVDRGAGPHAPGAPNSWAEYAASVPYCPECKGMGCETCYGSGVFFDG